MKKVCIMALDKSLNAEGLQALNLLKTAAESIFDSATAKEYSTLSSLLSQLGEKLAHNNAVIIAVAPSVFYNAKHGLRKALSMELVRSDDVTASLPTTYAPKTREEYEIVTGFPAECKIFMTHNGFLSGYAMQRGKQTILFLPLESSRLFPMLRDEVGPYLNAMFPAAPKPAAAAPAENQAIDDILFEVENLDTAPAPAESAAPSSLMAAAAAAEAPQRETVEAASQAPAAPAEAINNLPCDGEASQAAEEPAPQAPVEEPPAVFDPLTGALHRTVAALNSTQKCVGVALCGPVEGLRGLLQNIPNSRTAFIFDAEPAAKWNTGEFNPYFAEVAKATLNRCRTDFSVAVSALYTDNEKNDKFMFFVLATAQGANITKIADSAEAEADAVACQCLQAMAEAVEAATAGQGAAPAAPVAPVNAPYAAPAATANAPYGAPIDMPAFSEPAEGEKATVTVSKVPLIAAAVLLGIAIVAAVALGFWMNGKEPAAAEATTAVQAEITLPETTALLPVITTVKAEASAVDSTGDETTDEGATLDYSSLRAEASEYLADGNSDRQ